MSAVARQQAELKAMVTACEEMQAKASALPLKLGQIAESAWPLVGEEGGERREFMAMLKMAARGRGERQEGGCLGGKRCELTV